MALVGPSGCGKTSLLRCVAGLERPRTGRVALGDEVWFDAAAGINAKPEFRRVGYVPQDYGLFPHMTVAGNVRFAGRRDRPDLLERLGIADLAAVRPRELSGGERQRVAIARALAREPRVLLLDEPFGALDAITRRQVRDELADILADLRLPALLVTHAFGDAGALAHRVGVMEAGRIVQLDVPAQVVRAPATALVAALTGANVADGVAEPSGTGARVLLTGGGWVAAATTARGPVRVAIHPWELEIVAAEGASLVDRVVGVRPDADMLEVRLTRFVVRTRPAGLPSGVVEGAMVGLRADAAAVRVLTA